MNQILKKLSENIKLRKRLSSEKSYTSYLINAGTKECSKKFGEEAIELVIAANDEDLESFNYEAADVLYHFLVLIESKNADFNEILNVLASRQTLSGHEEKAQRKK